MGDPSSIVDIADYGFNRGGNNKMLLLYCCCTLARGSGLLSCTQLKMTIGYGIRDHIYYIYTIYLVHVIRGMLRCYLSPLFPSSSTRLRGRLYSQRPSGQAAAAGRSFPIPTRHSAYSPSFFLSFFPPRWFHSACNTHAHYSSIFIVFFFANSLFHILSDGKKTEKKLLGV